MEKFVITVNRQYASRGREVARRLSEILNVPCYDEELIEEAAEELELPEEYVGEEEETAVRKPIPVTRIPIILGKGSSNTQDEIFEAQAAFMKKIVQEESRKKLREVDELRDSYSIHYSGYLAEDKEYKDIIIDSNTLGVEKTAQYLAIAAKMKFGLE